MYRVLLGVVSLLSLLATPLAAAAQANQVLNTPAQPVVVLNTDTNYIITMIGVGAVNVALLALIWAQLSRIGEALTKQTSSSPPPPAA